MLSRIAILYTISATSLRLAGLFPLAISSTNLSAAVVHLVQSRGVLARLGLRTQVGDFSGLSPAPNTFSRSVVPSVQSLGSTTLRATGGSVLHRRGSQAFDSSGCASHPPSALSSCFCGHRMSLTMTARIIMVNTASHAQMSRHVITQPMILMGLLSSALPRANVAEVRAKTHISTRVDIR